MIGLVCSAGLLLLAVIVRVWFSLGAPEVMPESGMVCSPASSLIGATVIGFKVGGSFTGLIVTVNVRVIVLLEGWPSLTVTVMVTLPEAFGSGANEIEPVGFGLV